MRVWDAVTGTELAALSRETGSSNVAVSPDDRLAASCTGKSVLVWDLHTYTLVHEFKAHTSTVLAVNFSPDGEMCVSAARDGKAMVWPARSGALKFSVQCRDEDVAEALFTPDGSNLIVAGRSGSITLQRAADGVLVRELTRLRHGLNHVDVSPDGSRLAVASNVITLIDLAHGGVVGEIRRHVEHPYNLDFDARGERLLSCSTDKSVAVSEARPLRLGGRRFDSAEAESVRESTHSARRATRPLGLAAGTHGSQDALRRDDRRNAGERERTIPATSPRESGLNARHLALASSPCTGSRPRPSPARARSGSRCYPSMRRVRCAQRAARSI